MKTSRFSQLAVATFAALTLLATPIEAKRLGGGSGSKVGKPTNNAALQKNPAPAAAPAAAAAAPAAASAAAAKPANKWLGPLAGVAAGLGIAALMSSMGMGGALASMLSNLLIIGGLAFLAFFIYRKFFAKKDAAPALQGAGASPFTNAYQAPQTPTADTPAPQASAFQAPVAATATTANSVDASQYANTQHPAITDTTGFIANAKSQYTSLQAAWDAGDIAKLRNMTTDTLFMELAQQIANRKGAANHTEVMNLHCELLDVRDEASDTVATLRFTGTAREDGAATAGFEDVWTLTKPSNTASGWLLAGVESN